MKLQSLIELLYTATRIVSLFVPIKESEINQPGHRTDFWVEACQSFLTTRLCLDRPGPANLPFITIIIVQVSC